MRPDVILNAVLAATLAAAGPVVKRAGHNDYSCRSEKNPNPVVLLHGLGATYYEDINILESFLQTQGFCTFSLTYGAYPGFPFVGGLRPIKESSVEIANFVKSVKQKTGAAKIDLVGHSEGAFQTLYVTKFGGVKDIIQRVFSIAPPTHETKIMKRG
jgi:triacylglycerol esterase/lipase EstA (alpha/beta hydrolase family)